jgi:hypothetical protein
VHGFDLKVLSDVISFKLNRSLVDARDFFMSIIFSILFYGR